MNLSQFDYFLPEQLIANRPCSPRQGSRMLVGGLSLKDDKFINFTKYIEQKTKATIKDKK